MLTSTPTPSTAAGATTILLPVKRQHSPAPGCVLQRVYEHIIVFIRHYGLLFLPLSGNTLYLVLVLCLAASVLRVMDLRLTASRYLYDLRC